MTAEEQAAVTKVAESLQGTCDSEPEEMEGFSQEQLEELDNLIFRCTCCGWWCEAGEAEDKDGEDVCGNCIDE